MSMANADPSSCSQPSPKVAIVRFRRGMQQGLLGRISRSAVKEYHAFGIISYVHLSHRVVLRADEHPQKGGPPREVPLPDLRCARSVLSFRGASKLAPELPPAGDFTRSLVNDPPRTLWTRELKVGADPHDPHTVLLT